MKKLLVSLTVLVSICTANVNANVLTNGNDPVATGARTKNEKANFRIESTFNKEFKGAAYVSWERVKEHICQARFNYNNERMNAFFDVDGELIATGRFINENALPLLIKSSAGRKYENYHLQQVIELTQNSQTSYILTFENEKERLEVQAFQSGNLDLIKKEKRNIVTAL
jgi:hypothetical protein